MLLIVRPDQRPSGRLKETKPPVHSVPVLEAGTHGVFICPAHHDEAQLHSNDSMMKIWILFRESQEDLLNKQRRECGEKGRDTGPSCCKPFFYSKNAHPRVRKPIHVRKRLGCSHLRNAKYLPLPPAQMAPPISTLPWTVH